MAVLEDVVSVKVGWYADRQRGMMTMTINPTYISELRPVPEALYPRERFVMVGGVSKPVFLGHPNATCDECELRFGNKSRHPESEDVPGTVVICGGHLMRLITGRP